MLGVGSTYEGKEVFAPEGLKEVRTTLIEQTAEYQKGDGSWWVSYRDSKDRTIHIPQLELAKILFLHNTHLVRAAFRPNGLGSLANAREIDDDNREIKFSTISDYPASNLHSQSTLDHLIWLFFDTQARKSFHSIYGHLQAELDDYWFFRFSPFSLKNWRLTLLCSFDSDDEVQGERIKNLSHPGLESHHKVLFSHPRFRIRVNDGEKTSGGGSVGSPDENPLLDIPASPGIGRRLHRQHDKGFSFEIPHIMTTVVDGKSVPATSGGAPPVEGATESAGVGHATPEGTAQEFDYGLNRQDAVDEEEQQLHSAAPTERFKLFEQAIKQLALADDYALHSIQCISMPASSNGKLTYKRTPNGDPVTCHIASIYLQNRMFVVVEVDTECLTIKKSLSNLVVVLDEKGNDSLFDILRSCSDKGISWDKAQIRASTMVYRTCSHPPRERKVRGDEDGKRVRRSDAEYLESWASVLQDKIERCYDQLSNGAKSGLN